MLDGGQFGDTDERRDLKTLVEEFDERAWRIQREVEAGTVETERYLDAFAQARAANALWCALNGDALFASSEATYETNAALGGDIEAVRTAIEAII